ncbi:MAG: glycerate kinase [Thermodesulfobacteriota bacterium]|jgi:glycerate-2-kinase|nr:MAG: glycerate kinase [Candidatus Dadabacteria bacterium]
MIVSNVERSRLDKIFSAGLGVADATKCVSDKLIIKDNVLFLGDKKYNLTKQKKIFLISFGKAAYQMAKGAYKVLGKRITKGLIISNTQPKNKISNFKFILSTHPVPDERSLKAANSILNILATTGKDDLVFFLISGGGSAMIALPDKNVTMEDKRITTQLLLRSGVDTNTLNTVRKKISKIKGGGLLKEAYPSKVITLILSDVVGDKIDIIASGPSLPDKSSAKDAWREICELGIENKLPPRVVINLENPIKEDIKKIKYPSHNTFLVGNNLSSLQAAKEEAEKMGYNSIILTSQISGEAKVVAKAIASIAIEIKKSNIPILKPACIIVGGETAVKVRGSGLGGRNSELALAFSIEIMNEKGISALFAGTDGIDGPTDAAGAYCNGKSRLKARELGVSAKDSLVNNDSYSFFKKIGDLKITGPTGTNVNDIGIILIEK